MGLGRRSAPSAPPVPVRPLPPSAYGIAVPGAPVPAQQQFAQQQFAQQQFTPPPNAPPPAVPPQAPPPAPSPFADYAVAPVAQPVTTFGAPPSTFGAPAAYGTPVWSTTPPKQRGSRLWAKIVAGLVVALVGGVVLLHLYVAATRHHVTTLPPSLQGVDQDLSPISQEAIAVAIARAHSDGTMRDITNFQAGVYRSGSAIIVVDMGDIPSNSAAFRSRILNSMGGTNSGVTFTSVTPGHQGGSESCGVQGTNEICVWADNGTMGAVFLNETDQVTAMGMLQSLRDAAER